MSATRMTLEGTKNTGLVWRILVDDLELLKTDALAKEDLEEAIFSITRDSSRKNSYFYEVSDQELFLVLDGFFSGSLNRALRASAEEQTWARHLVSPALSASVWSRMYLIGCRENTERLLTHNNHTLRTFLLPEGNYDLELRRISKQLAALR